MPERAPSSRYAWGVVTLLAAAYVLSFIDRQVLGLLITPIKQSMQLSDTELGLLMGPAFAIFYVTLGWPIGWLADRANRRNIIAAGIALWSLMTMGCGLSRTFTQLFVTRIGVGVGEAALTPSALSIIVDMFPPAVRPRAISFYTNGIYIGSGLAYLVGGAVIGAVSGAGPVTVPVAGALEGWQVAFLIVGAPGLIVALAVLCIREPTRTTTGSSDRPDAQSARYLFTRWKAFGAPCLGMCATTVVTYLGGWYTPLLQRVWDWPVERIGFWLGVNYLIFGPLGTTVAGWLAERMARQGIEDGPYRLLKWGTVLVGVSATLLPLAPSPELLVLGQAVFVFAGAVTSPMAATAIVVLAPTRLRAQASAIYFLIINLVGLLVGPTLVGVLADRVFTTPTGIAPAIAVVSLGAAVPALIALWLGARPYAREIATMSASPTVGRA